MPGKLLIVSSPIGNLDDVSPRAQEALKQADLVACEDTRHSGRLLAHLGIHQRLVSLHQHNERRRLPQLKSQLQQGSTIALLSDAGTPLLSDPGYPLVQAAIELGCRIEPIPGPSALLAALVVSGLPTHAFTFAGFPPPKSGKRQRFYARYADLPHTLVFYESPHRLLASLSDAEAIFGDRPAAVARELTKLHEEVLRASLSQLRAVLGERPSLKGEFVLLIGPAVAAGKTERESGAAA